MHVWLWTHLQVSCTTTIIEYVIRNRLDVMYELYKATTMTKRQVSIEEEWGGGAPFVTPTMKTSPERPQLHRHLTRS